MHFLYLLATALLLGTGAAQAVAQACPNGYCPCPGNLVLIDGYCQCPAGTVFVDGFCQSL